MTARTQCSYCEGTKIFIKFKCLECEGMGRKTYDNPIEVDIPPGTLHGEVFRVDLDTENLMMVENNHKVGHINGYMEYMITLIYCSRCCG